MSEYAYAWPSSKLTPADMRLLHDARESHPDHPPITVLVAQAIRAQFGRLASQPEPTSEPERGISFRRAA